MMENLLDVIFNSCFTFSVPVWIVLIVVIFACWLLYWDKNFRLRINGKPKLLDATHNSLTVAWNEPTFADPSHNMVYIRKVSEPEAWECITTEDGSNSLTISNLTINTKYFVKVRACKLSEHGPLGDKSSPVSTKTLAFKIKQESHLRPVTVPNTLSMYDVPYQVEQNEQQQIRKIIIGDRSIDEPDQGLEKHKIVMIASTPHSGKTTLLQGIMNFILGVSYEDDFRLCFPPELTSKSNDYQDWVTLYQFLECNGGKLELPLTLIDIPRLRGSRKDYIKKIHRQLKYISTTDELEVDSVCFVTRSNDFSFPFEQIEYLKSIQKLFENDSDAGTCCFLTFSDPGPAHIQNVLESNEVNLSNIYSVNWSTLYQTNKTFSLSLWKSNNDMLCTFFDHLKVSFPKRLRDSLQENTPAPKKREELMSDIAILQPEVTENLIKLYENKEHFDTIFENKEVILSDGDFSFTIEEIKQTQTPLKQGFHVTNCTQCFYTCHEDCSIPDDERKEDCEVMMDGFCTKCTGKCKWYLHKNMPFIFCYTSVQVTKSYKEMKSCYEKDKGRPLEFEEYLENLTKDIELLLGRIHDKIKKITEYKNELQGIERSPLAGTFDDTIDDMIRAERLKKAIGFEKRIEMFLELKKYSKLIRIRQD